MQYKECLVIGKVSNDAACISAKGSYTEAMALKVLYSIFIGLLVALFVGLGIAAFYPGPTAPEYPSELSDSRPVIPEGQTAPVETEEQKALRKQYDADQKQYREDNAAYNRRVSIVSLIAAVIVLVTALALVNTLHLISDGLLLGGVLTLAYSIIRGFMGENNIYRFTVVAIGLIITLIIGYIKFIKPDKK